MRKKHFRPQNQVEKSMIYATYLKSQREYIQGYCFADYTWTSEKNETKSKNLRNIFQLLHGKYNTRIVYSFDRYTHVDFFATKSNLIVTNIFYFILNHLSRIIIKL